MPQGGVARRATKINEIRNKTHNTVLLLDAGNTLFGEFLANQSEGRVVVEAMNAMRYDAMTIGWVDLSKGLNTFLARAREARFPILCCNLVNKNDQKPLLAPYITLERDGMRLGIIGVTETEVATAPGVANVAQALDPVATVRQYLPEVRSKSDVVILLSHLGLEIDKALARQVPGIDIIIGGKTRKLLSQPERVEKTVITQMGYDGEWLGRLDVKLSENYQIIESRVEVVTLGPDVADDATLAGLVKTWKERFPEPTPRP